MAIRWWTEQVQFADGSRQTPYYDLSITAQRVWDLGSGYISLPNRYSGIAKNTYFDLGYLMRDKSENIVNHYYYHNFVSANFGVQNKPTEVSSTRLGSDFGINTISTVASIYCRGSSKDYTSIIGFIVDDVNHTALVVRYGESTSGGNIVQFIYSFRHTPSTTLYNALIGAIPLIGDYYPVANLYSVNGNTPLSMIKHEYNNSGEQTGGTIERVERTTFQSDLKAVFNDMVDGETRLLFYCGDNRVYMTRHEFELRAGDFYVYKFSLSYSFGGQPTDGDMTVRYETNVNIGDKSIYFGFWVDDTHGIAQPCVIFHDLAFDYEQAWRYNYEYTTIENTLRKYYRWLSSYGDTPEKPNPFDDNPQNNEASGGENFRPRGNENIPFNSLPTKSGITAHLFTVYNPSESELVRFADYLWSDDFLDNFKKLFQNPIDCVIGLAMIPCTIPADSKTSARIYAGNVDTLISSSKVINRFVTLDMGTLEISPVWDGYLDFSPYTKIEIYLPFCGSHSLDTDDIVQAMTSNDRTGKPKTGTTLHLRYVIDVVTGCCVAQIEVYPTGATGDASVHYQFTGNCSIELPLASASYNNLTSSLVQTAGSIISTIATKGATAPMLAGNVMSTVSNLKPEIQKTGANTSVFGMLSENIPYVTITEPITAYSNGESLYKGFPSYMTKQLNTCTGYTKVFDVHLDDIVCTDTERDEIYRLLKGGVIL